MAAVISKDPFVDPSKSSKSHRPPPPPPSSSTAIKSSLKTNTKSQSQMSKSGSNDITEASYCCVSNFIFSSLLGLYFLSSTIMSSISPPASPPTASRPSARRTQTEDSANITEKPRSSAKPRSKKGSQHADVIDRLDFTGVGPMFHHDGPFDACAPSRNKHRNKAPMYAWADDPNNVAYGDSAYPAPSAYTAFSNDYQEPPKKKVDAIAEAWGIHEPEPFEEFFAGGGSGRAEGDTPASSIYNGKDPVRARRPKDPKDDRPAQQTRTTRRSLVPPPQPIFSAEALDADSAVQGSPPPPSPGFPKRSKSLMHRIRKMRDSPNVPVGADYEQPPSPSSPVDPTRPNAARPTHRTQNSFLGRFGGGSRANQPPADNGGDKPEPYVFIDAQNNKDLPLPPPIAENNSGQAESGEEAYNANLSSSPGLGRKTSLMKKVGKVVRGSK
ncbi:hypothetical protein CVT24_000532 [Panaeolus cyanescens]|uniref:Pal1 cell morphology protein n=1 Tax=Panaeolus cyanescens TaxID=181874 RepID=A0A409V8H0_9AGAR|nr:hypothetical protein CVT24_000532 [Panaeolus cyanescens]